MPPALSKGKLISYIFKLMVVVQIMILSSVRTQIIYENVGKNEEVDLEIGKELTCQVNPNTTQMEFIQTCGSKTVSNCSASGICGIKIKPCKDGEEKLIKCSRSEMSKNIEVKTLSIDMNMRFYDTEGVDVSTRDSLIINELLTCSVSDEYNLVKQIIITESCPKYIYSISKCSDNPTCSLRIEGILSEQRCTMKCYVTLKNGYDNLNRTSDSVTIDGMKIRHQSAVAISFTGNTDNDTVILLKNNDKLSSAVTKLNCTIATVSPLVLYSIEFKMKCIPIEIKDECSRTDTCQLLVEPCEYKGRMELYCTEKFSRMSKKLNLKHVVDGGWAEWLRWTEWSPLCGNNSKRTTYRLCKSPHPKNGGADCPGNKTRDEIRYFFQACIKHGNWAKWSSWSPCPVTCDFGIQRKNRSCSNPPPGELGKPCAGRSTEIKKCFLVSCANYRKTILVSWSFGVLLGIPSIIIICLIIYSGFRKCRPKPFASDDNDSISSFDQSSKGASLHPSSNRELNTSMVPRSTTASQLLKTKPSLMYASTFEEESPRNPTK